MEDTNLYPEFRGPRQQSAAEPIVGSYSVPFFFDL